MNMILLITPSARGQECAATVKDATGEETHWAENLPQAVARLREQSYSAVVLDQFLLENEPAESDQVIEHLGTAFPVYLNFAVSGMERLLREVRSALHRRKREETQARHSVEQQIRSEVCESLTAYGWARTDSLHNSVQDSARSFRPQKTFDASPPLALE
jgi:hypothetical protein